MENQVNVGDQNTQQVGQNSVSQSVINLGKPKINYFIIAGIILAGFIIFGVSGYHLGRKSLKSLQTTGEIQNQPTTVPSLSPTIDPTANWKSYANSKYNYSFKYPSGYQIDSCRGCTDLATVTYVSIQSPSMAYNNQGYGTITVSVTSPDINKIRSLEQIKIGSNIDAYTETTASYGYQTKYVYVIANDNSVITLEYSGVGSQANKNIPIKEYKDYQIFDQTLSTFQFTSSQPQSADACVTEKDNILSLVTTFETLQKNKNPKGVLALFTAPQLPDDISDYQNLSGKDANIEPRLYNNVSTNFNTQSYKITQQPVKSADSSCVVQVEEQRSNYGGPANPQYLPAQAENFALAIKKESGEWIIDHYESLDPKIKKGKYSGFLMEYAY